MDRFQIAWFFRDTSRTVTARVRYDHIVSPVGRSSDTEGFPISATLFVTYLTCPQQAVARVSGIYPKSTKAMFRGSLAHRIFALHLTDGPIEPDAFIAACREQVGTHLGGTMASLSLKPSEFRTITAEVEELYDRFRSVSIEGFDGAEVEIDTQTADGTAIRGRIDAVFVEDAGVRIVDWKTGSYLDNALSQLEFYAMAWFEENGELPVTVEALSLKTGERRVSHPTTSTVAATSAQVSEMLDAIRRAVADGTELSRTAGPHCRWCPILDDCEEGTAALKILD